jgi:adenylate kinase
MRVAITGTPGTGKSKVSKELSKLTGFKLVDVNEFSKKEKLILYRDKERETDVVDTKALKTKTKKISDDLIFEGHLSHFIEVDVIFVLRCRPDILKKRLEKKKWKKKKIQENLEAEILGVIACEARSENKKVVEIDTSGKTPNQAAKEIWGILKKQDFKSEIIDWLEEYQDMLSRI